MAAPMAAPATPRNQPVVLRVPKAPRKEVSRARRFLIIESVSNARFQTPERVDEAIADVKENRGLLVAQMAYAVRVSRACDRRLAYPKPWDTSTLANWDHEADAAKKNMNYIAEVLRTTPGVIKLPDGSDPYSKERAAAAAASLGDELQPYDTPRIARSVAKAHRAE